ncbi:pseudoazurin [Nitrogeniibacter mangrovi]|uniref:Pseudoazurin n=1 Tax=Nitrogeniibacter mangrovi TaxID=2016596 RepID=A0A6C1B3M7_9RHOO|nr:plastocyanin/azurin family copper-binding protein [Nitrogeniibacter mangrovi]QID16930.1 pseudoazurin [Nitrogeniibacter mangrovi]
MNRTRNAAGRLVRLLCVGTMAVAGAQAAQADDIRIRMLDTSASGPLAFQPGFVKAKVGDTVIFEPTPNGGHSSVSLLVPPGAHAWSGEADTALRVKLEAEGVYLYACAAHERMGMVGVIQVGTPVNLAAAQAMAKKTSATFVMNKDRFTQALAQVK